MLLPHLPLDPRSLAESLWEPSDLPDRRLWVRLVKIVVLLFARFDAPAAQQPRAERRGMQRFCDNPRVSAQTLEKRPRERTLGCLAVLPRVLMAHDTTEVDRVGPTEPDDAGPLRSNAARGYLVHSAVAIDPDSHHLLGVVDTQAWTRSWVLRKQDHKGRPPHERESIKWRRGIRRVVAQAKAQKVATTLVHLMDREGDVHENFTFARRHRYLVTVRAAHDRAILEGPGMLRAHLDARPVADAWVQPVRAAPCPKAKKAAQAQGREALDAFEARLKRAGRTREAKLELRFATVTFAGHKHGRKPVSVEAIQVREVDPPADLEAVSWVVLTTCEVRCAAQARSVVRDYEARYGIEPVHRIWKSGLHLEREPVEGIASFRRLLAVLVPAATQIARWTYAARESPRTLAAPYVSSATLAVLKEACRFRHIPLPRRAWTLHDVVQKLAQLGGFEPRPKHRPGWITLWRGWRELTRFEAILKFARRPRKEGPD